MKRYIGAIVLGVACFALGAAFQRYYDLRSITTAPQSQTAKAPPEPDNRIVEDKTGVNPAAIRFEHEPLWAYGFETPPKPGDKAQPQAPPNRNLRPNQDPAEQTQPPAHRGTRLTFRLTGFSHRRY